MVFVRYKTIDEVTGSQHASLVAETELEPRLKTVIENSSFAREQRDSDRVIEVE